MPFGQVEVSKIKGADTQLTDLAVKIQKDLLQRSNHEPYLGIRLRDISTVQPDQAVSLQRSKPQHFQ